MNLFLWPGRSCWCGCGVGMEAQVAALLVITSAATALKANQSKITRIHFQKPINFILTANVTSCHHIAPYALQPV